MLYRKVMIGIFSLSILGCAQQSQQLWTIEEKEMLFEATAKIIENQKQIKEEVDKVNKETIESKAIARENKKIIENNRNLIKELASIIEKSTKLNNQENKKIASLIANLNSKYYSLEKRVNNIEKNTEEKIEKLKKLVIKSFQNSHTTVAVNLREGPGKSLKKIGTIPQNKNLKVLDLVVNEDNEVWAKVKYKKKEGYILANYLEPGKINKKVNNKVSKISDIKNIKEKEIKEKIIEEETITQIDGKEKIEIPVPEFVVQDKEM